MITRHPLLTLGRQYLEEAADAYMQGHGLKFAFVPQRDPAGPPAWPFVTIGLDWVGPDGVFNTLPAMHDAGQVVQWERAVIRVSVYDAQPSDLWRAARAYFVSSNGGVWVARKRAAVREITNIQIVTDELDGAGARLRGDFDLTIAAGHIPANIGIHEIGSVEMEFE